MNKTRRTASFGALIAATALTLFCVWHFWDLGHRPLEKLDYLVGATETEVLRDLGEPTREEAIVLSAEPQEPGLYSLVQSKYAASNPTRAGVKVRILHWNKRRVRGFFQPENLVVVAFLDRTGSGWHAFSAVRFRASEVAW